MTAWGNNMRSAIAEWLPFYYGVDLGFWALFIFTTGLGWRYRKKIELWRWGIFGILFVAGLSSLRHMALFAVAAMPVLAKILEEMNGEFGKGEAKERWKWFYRILVGVAVVLVMVEVGVGLINYRGLSEEKFYPKKAVKWLKLQNYSGNLFSDYGWGGYLIWKWPGKKLFVDGRMAIWREYNEWAFRDYLKISRDGEYKELFDKYDVGVVLWPKRELARKGSIWQINLPKWWPKQKEGKSLVEELKKDGWQKAYEDDISLVYRK